MDKPVNQQLQSPLFRIPVEIRLSIYSFTLETHLSGPKTPAEADLIGRCPVIEAPGPRLRYPKCYQSLDLCLLSTCRKANSEIEAFGSSHRSPHRAVCRLDIIITDHHALPTWLTAPSHKRNTSYDLEVSLRLFDIWDPTPLFGGDDWIGTLSCPLIKILNDLIHRGPQFLSAKEKKSPSPQYGPEYWKPGPLRFNAVTFNTSCPSSRSHGVSHPRNLTRRDSESRKAHLDQQALASVDLFMCYLEESGLLWGKIQELRVCSMQAGMGKAVKVTHKEIDQAKVDLWAENGFTWGLDA
ncbi:MAG: hypothetical protein Q9195_004082 [Heterodermia aff. obscurata]